MPICIAVFITCAGVSTTQFSAAFAMLVIVEDAPFIILPNIPAVNPEDAAEIPTEE